ncbi:MAG: tail fiber protein, partial [Pseudomonadota bacterium]
FVDRTAGASINTAQISDRIADYSNTIGTSSRGILDSTETDMVFVLADSNVAGGSLVTYETSFVFDISDATSLTNIQMSFAASGDFEGFTGTGDPFGTNSGDSSFDVVEIVARIDGGSEFVVFAPEVDQDNFDNPQFTYFLENGSYTDNDPFTLLDDATGTTRVLDSGPAGQGGSLSQFTSNAVAGQSGSTLELIVRSNMNGAEVVLFDDVIINGDVPPPPELSMNFDDNAISENGGSTTGTITRTGDTTNALVVTLASDDTSEATVPTSVTIAAGQASATFAVTAVDDAFRDFDKSVGITASATGFDDRTNFISVTDDEETIFSVDITETSINEDGSPITGTVSHNFETTTGNTQISLASSEFSRLLVPNTAFVPAGQNSTTFTITPVDDALINGDQDVTITASGLGATSGTDVITIIDNDTPTFTFEFPSGNFIVEDGGTRPVTITRTGDTTAELVATLAVDQPGDVSVPGTVTFMAGSATASFDVTGIDDDLFEFTEPVTITASATGYEDASTAVNVLDDDAFTSSLEITETSVDEDAGTITATLTHNLATGGVLVANLSSSDTSEATVPVSITAQSGEFTKTFDITLIDDGINDGDQTVTISASNVSGSLGSDTITVVDVNLPLEVAFDAPSVRENGGTVNGTVTRQGDTTGDLVVTLSSNDTGEATVPPSVTIAAGEASADFIVTGVDDMLDDGTQTVTITASAAGEIDGTQTIDVIDNEVSVDTRMPALAVNYSVQNIGLFPTGGNTSTTPLGTINTFAFGQELGLDANGDLLPIASNSDLFSLVGTQYGGDGRTSLGLPDLEGVLAVGDGNGTGLTPRQTGDTFGSDDVALTQNNFPASLGGTSTSASNVEESQVINYYIATTGVFPSAGSGASQGFLGQMIAHIGELPFTSGWVKADGRELQISDNPALFSIIGNIYGGDGRTTFALPDLQGRVPIGAGTGPGLNPVSLGQKLGSEDFTIADANLPGSVGGSDAAIDNYQPSLGINYLVSLTGLFPSSTTDGSDFVIGQIVPFAGTFAPAGFAFAHGQSLQPANNPALFSLIGNTYGGNNVTTFALPDLRGRALVDDGGTISLGDELGSQEFSITDVPYAPIPAVTAISEDTGTPGDGFTSDTTLEISGTALAGAVVEVFIDGTSIGTATADMNGDWTFDYTGTELSIGAFTITATALVNGIVSDPSSSFALEIVPPLTLTVTLDDTEIPEDGGGTTGTVTRSGVTSADLVVTLASNDETEATVPATVTILAGETSATFAVAAGTTDALVDRLDGDQTATITASATGFPDGTADITVTESHFTVVNTPTDTSIAEGESTTYTVTRSGDISAAATYAISNINPSAISAPATVSFAAGEATATFTVTGVLDGVVDGDEFGGASASPDPFDPFSIVSSTGLTVTNIDVPSLFVTIPTPLDEDAAGAQGSVRRTGDTTSAVTVSLSSDDVGELTVPSSVTIGAGETEATFFVTPVGDSIVDGDQTVTVTATGAGLVDGTFDVTVRNSDTLTLTLTLDDPSISENGGSTTATLTHNLESTSPITVPLGSNDTSEATVPSTVTFADGSRSATFTVTGVDDPDFDGDQIVTIQAIFGGSIASADLTVVNDDTTVLSVSFADPSISEAGGTTTGTVTRVGDTTGALEVTLSSDDTGEATVPGTVTILAGEASADFVITAVNDADDDDDQTVTIGATATGAQGGSSTLIVTDNEPGALSISFADSSISENGGTTTGTVTRSSDTDAALVVTLTSVDTGEVTVPTEVTILAGESSADFVVTGVDEIDIDDDQTVSITASASVVASGSADMVVTDDETIRGTALSDFLIGGVNAERLLGLDSNDNLRGGGGADILDGGDGIDLADYSNNGANLTVDLSDPSRNTGDAAGDTYISIEGVRGVQGFGNDLTASDDGTRMTGGDEGDTLTGGDGDDFL